MPTYEYECTACGQHIEIFQRFTEDALTTCGVCGGPLRKVFHPAGIVFKGSGFYATDSRSSQGAPSKQKDTDGATSPSSARSSDGAKSSDGGKDSDGAKSSDGGKTADTGKKSSTPKDGSSS
ncbi:MAG: FmdB family zinc ribbon protein [Actinomycetota bacterium]